MISQANVELKADKSELINKKEDLAWVLLHLLYEMGVLGQENRWDAR